MAPVPRPLRILALSVIALGFAATACQKDDPAQDAPPGIFTTTLGDTTPEAPPTSAP